VSTLRRLSAAPAATEVRLRAGQQQGRPLPPGEQQPPSSSRATVAGGRRAPRESLGANADEDDEETCGVCLDAEVALRVRPCGHRLCVACLRLLLRAELQQQQQQAVQRHHSQQQQQACPFCRGPLRGFEYCAVLPGEAAEAPEDDDERSPPPRGEELC
jgi:hypothetical protein